MTELELSAGEYEAGVAPALGGALTFLRQSGRDLLRPAASLDAIREDPRSAASFVCVPYFGRLYGGLDFAGRHWDMAPTVPACDPKSALHGEGWISPWTLEDGSPESVTLRLVHDGQAEGRFPFAYVAEQRIVLSEKGLSIVLTVTNAGDHPMPAAPALHPYFPRTPATRLTFSAKGFWTPPQGNAPGQAGPIPQALDFSNGGVLPETPLDHSYSGFGGTVLIETGTSRTTLSSDAPFLHVYAPKGEGFFCLEPLTGLPGARELPILAKGDTARIQLNIAAA
ncbi:MAG: hypothetical protein R3C54_05955 [Parvularculaceae bacterium]